MIDKEQTKNYIKTVVNKAAQDIVAGLLLFAAVILDI